MWLISEKVHEDHHSYKVFAILEENLLFTG